ncbi:MAG: heme exporter protein CcmD [Hyphomonadaceae bacterium]|nr:heme exporter protein CcmD [Hyphomonadaceae bacterium]
MIEALTHLMADRHWPYIWPCYALAVATFVALAVRAALNLRKWEKAARE